MGGDRVSEPTLMERRLRIRLTRMYSKTAEREQRKPAAMAKADAKRARKAAKRLASQ